MQRIRKLPYRIPLQEHLVVEKWLYIMDGKFLPLEETLSSWDPAMNLSILAFVRIDIPGIFNDCDLGSNAQLLLCPVWESSGTVMRGAGKSVDITETTDNSIIQLSLDIEGINLAKNLDVFVVLVLISPGTGSKEFAPKAKGSLLIQSERRSVLLEGFGARFPVEIVDFKNTHYPNDAGWALYWNSDDLHQSMMGDVCLYINSRNNRVVKAVSEMRPEDFDLCEAIRWDVARTMIGGALANPEFIENPDEFEPGSVGSTMRNILRLYFPEESLSQLHDHSCHPTSFEPKLQDHLRLFWK